jgi:3-oxoadipate enol-lactonase
MGNRNNYQHTPIFVHGAGSNADFWHLQLAAFPEAHFVNLPGHRDQGSGIRDQGSVEGRQLSEVGRPSSIQQYADWLEGYVESNGLQQVALNGHSMGGAIALDLALRRPRWLSTLILTCAGARYPVPTRLMQLLREDFEAAVDLIIAQSFGSHEGTLTYAQKAQRYGTRRQMLRTPQEVVLADYEACIGFDVRQRLNEIEVPTLIIAGALDRVTPPRLSRELHEGIKESRLVIVDGAGHMLPMESPDEHNALVERFLLGSGLC